MLSTERSILSTVLSILNSELSILSTGVSFEEKEGRESGGKRAI